ncbi:hypothetical protein BC831DRAFT_464860 [Entophlyctis helioformis]|nr:hypothetical protein BC831DRAFT_464860 [Entophlyctis helioformis]
MSLPSSSVSSSSSSTLSTSELQAIQVSSRISACLSIASFLGTIVCRYLKPKWFSNSIGRLVLALAVADVVDAVAKAAGRLGPNSGAQSFLCQAQATIIQEATLASVFFGLTVAVYMLFIMYFQGSLAILKRFEKQVIALCFLAPLPFTITPLVVKTDGLTNMIGDGDIFCWIGKKDAVYQIYLFYVIVWAVFVVQLVAYFLTWYGIYRLEQEIQTISKSSGKGSSVYRTIMVKRMMAYTLAFMITWTPSSLNRMYQISTGSTLFPLALLQAIFSPLRGTVDFGVFLYNRSITHRSEAAAHKQTSGTGDSNILSDSANRETDAAPFTRSSPGSKRASGAPAAAATFVSVASTGRSGGRANHPEYQLYRPPPTITVTDHSEPDTLPVVVVVVDSSRPAAGVTSSFRSQSLDLRLDEQLMDLLGDDAQPSLLPSLQPIPPSPCSQ